MTWRADILTSGTIAKCIRNSHADIKNFTDLFADFLTVISVSSPQSLTKSDRLSPNMSKQHESDGGAYPCVEMTKHTLIWINQKETAIIRGLMGLCADAFQGLCVWAAGRGSHSNKIIIWLIPMNPICGTCRSRAVFSLNPTWEVDSLPNNIFSQPLTVGN